MREWPDFLTAASPIVRELLGNPDTLVTPTFRCPLPNLFPRQSPSRSCRDRRERRNLSKGQAMTKHATGTREEWLTARTALLAREKAMFRELDALRAERRELPWVKIEKPYTFDGPK